MTAITTIAWDGKTLAADSQCGGAFVSHVQKIFRTDNGLVAGAGDYALCLKLRDHINKNGVAPIELPSGCGLGAIVIDNGGRCWNYDSNGYPMQFKAPFAEGSGAQLAIAAMHCGKTAQEAIKIASIYDSDTGGKVQTATIDG